MAMRASPANTCALSRRPEVPEPQGQGIAQPADELIMVLFPRPVWDLVVALAADMGVAPSEALGEALVDLRARVDPSRGGG